MKTFQCFKCDPGLPCELTVPEPVPRIPWGCPWCAKLKDDHTAPWIEKVFTS